MQLSDQHGSFLLFPFTFFIITTITITSFYASILTS